MMIRSVLLATLMVLVISTPPAAAAGNAELRVVFGPQVFTQYSSARATETVNFSLDPPAEAPFLLTLSSTGRNTVILNGIQIYAPEKGSPISKYVDLSVTGNTLEVEMAGGAGSHVAVTIVGYRYALARDYANLPVVPFDARGKAPNPLTTDSLADTPVSVDWRDSTTPVVTPVKDQGECRASWAFSATGAVEGAWALAGNKLVSLSEQELTDCAGVQGTCVKPGSPTAGFNYAIQEHGIEAEVEYPYVAQVRSCKASASKGVAHIGSWSRVTPGSEAALEAAVAASPVSVMLNGNWLLTYKRESGVVDPCHGIELPDYYSALIVGYTQGYWIVKTSLGTSWGMEGYFELARGHNACGIANYAVIPSVRSLE